MATAVKPVNHGKAWVKEEIFTVASYLPTNANCEFLAEHLGRTPHAIQYLWCKLYSKTSVLKEWAKPENDTKTGQYRMILEVRKELGLIHMTRLDTSYIETNDEEGN